MNFDGICIAGVGLHPFGRYPGKTTAELASVATREALADAGMEWSDIDVAFGGSLQANPDCMVAVMGQTGIPFINVKNGCASAGSAIYAAAMAVASGAHDIALAVGADNHERGAFRNDPGEWGMPRWYAESGFAVAPQFFAMKTRQYFEAHDLPLELLVAVAERSFRNGARTPHAWRRQALESEAILASPMLCNPLRKFMLTNPCAGGGAAIICRKEVAARFENQPMSLRGLAIKTRVADTFEVGTPYISVDVSPSPSVFASREAFEIAGVDPGDIDVVQLQDTDSGTEIIHYAECGFCADGEQEELIASGATEIGGRLPINTDGGLLANGEPVGASGLRQVYEVALQLRGRAEGRQVPGNPRLGFTHVYGGPGVSAVVILES